MGMVPAAPVGPALTEAALTEAACRAYYRKLAAGVAVVTVCGEAGWSGATVSTLTSVSMNPAILLCCLSHRSRTLAAIRGAGRFAVHLLADDQADLADRFSRSSEDGSQFEGLRHELRLIRGAPVIGGVLAVGWCDLHSLDEVGDHCVVYGRLSAVHVGQGSPLLWHESAFQSLDAEPVSVRTAA